MNKFKALCINLYYIIFKGSKYIRSINADNIDELLKENPTLEEVEEEFEMSLYGVDINARFECNGTLLSTAITYCSDLKIIQFIVDQGFDLNPSDSVPLSKEVLNPIFQDFAFEDNFNNSDDIKLDFYKEVLKILFEGGANPNHKHSIISVVGGFETSLDRTKLQIEVLELFIKYGVNLDFQDEEGKSILFYCDEERDQEIVKFLLEQGANPNLVDKESDTALQSYYKYLSADGESIILIKLFLENGWNPDNQNDRKQSFIFDVVDRFQEKKDIVALLLDYKVSIDIVDVFGKRVLDYAEGDIALLLKEAGATSAFNELDKQLMSLTSYWNSKENNIDEVKELLAQGANVNVSENNMETPLYHAVYAQDVTLVKLLLSYKPNLNVIEESYGESALHQAAYKGNIEIATLLLEAGADVNIQSNPEEPTPLFSVKSLEMLKLFITYGANINAKDSEGKSVLSKIVTPRVENAGLIGDEDEYIYDAEGVEKIELLLSEGIKLEEDQAGNTIFHDAARGGSVTFLKLLHRHKVSYKALNNEKESVLQFAVKFGHFEAVKHLIELGVDINTVDEYGATALYEAGREEYKNIEQYLLEKGANPKHRYNEETSEVVKGNLDYL